ncbi:AttA family protein [Megaselia abdita]
MFIVRTLLALSLVVFVSAASISSGAQKSSDGTVSGQGVISGQVGNTNRVLSVQGNSIPGSNQSPPSGNAQAQFSVENNEHQISVGLSQSPKGSQISQQASVNLVKTDSARADISLSHSKTSTDYSKYSANQGTLSFSDKNGNVAGVSLRHIPGHEDSLSQNVNVNVLKTPDHKVNIGGFNDHTKLKDGVVVLNFGGRASYENSKGTKASVGVEHSPQLKLTKLSAGAQSDLTQFGNGARIEGNLNVVQGGRNDRNLGVLISVPFKNQPSVQWKTPMNNPISPAYRNIPDYAAFHSLPQYADRKFVFIPPDDPRLDPDWYPGCGPVCCKGKKYSLFWCV